MKTSPQAPLLFRIANRLAKANVRGSSRVMRMLAAQGVLDVLVEYPLGKFTFGVPLWRNPLDLSDITSYESDLIRLFCSRLSGKADWTLFDCGADIGIFSAAVCARSEAVSAVRAFEPNSEAFPFLEKNIAALPVSGQVIASAVADFVGTGKLESPSYDPDYTARFLVPGDGPIRVTTIDSYREFGKNIAIKIDVEGGEMAVLRGADQTIRSATNCVIAMEAHAQVAKRTGRDPVECLRLLKSLRQFQFTVAETGEDLEGDREVIRPGQAGVLNVVCAAV